MKKIKFFLSVFALSMSVTGFAQTITVTGSVQDAATKEGVPFAAVQVKGTTTGTTADIDGNYSINVNNGTTLVFSSIGYETVEVQISGKSVINVSLETSNILDETVVIGYGTVKKRDLTGAVASIKASDITAIPTANVLSAIQGRVAGINISQTSWTPGADPSMTIRGERSINASNSPLYVVDGIPWTTGIGSLAPSDIESIEVLKDASATAIYGSRGANGVIIVTTKKGTEGRTIVEYNGYVGVQTIQNKLNMMDAAEFVEYSREAYRTAGTYKSDGPSLAEDSKIPIFTTDPYTWESLERAYDANGNYDPSKLRSFDWFDYMTNKAAIVTDHQVSVRGGSAKTNFMISGSYNYQNGVPKDKSFKRYTVRTNINHEIKDWLKVGANLQLFHSEKERGSGWEGDAYVYRICPLGQFINEDGSTPMLISGDSQGYNPLCDLQAGAVSRPEKKSGYNGSIYVDINFPHIKGLSFRSNLGLDHRTTQSYEFFGGNTVKRQGGNNEAINGVVVDSMYSLENYFTYDRMFGVDHHFTATLLQSIQQSKTESTNTDVARLPSDQLLYYYQSSGLDIQSISSGYSKWNMASFMARVNYAFKGRYLFTVSARYDGASMLADGHKWVLFPSGSFAWRISDEPWMKGVNWISDLKLRAGYGMTGNAAIDPYTTLGELGKNDYVYDNGKIETYGFAPSVMANKDLTWETTDQYNIGLDFGLIRNRITGSLDFYKQYTHDLLLEKALPVVTGYTSVMSNIGATSNTGIELQLTSHNFEKKNFGWTTDLTFSYNNQRIESLFNDRDDFAANNWFIGYPVNVYYDYEFDGIWQDTPEDRAAMEAFNKEGSSFKVGGIKIKDQDENNKINEQDRVVLGSKTPKFMVGFNNTFTFHGFDLNIFLYSNFGYMLKNSIEYYQKAGRSNTISIPFYSAANPSNEWPRPDQSQESMSYVSAIQYSKADFLRVKNITLGYTIPQNITQKANISKVRFYVSANNPWIWTKFKGVDPEGANGRTTPSYSSWIFGVNFAF